MTAAPDTPPFRFAILGGGPLARALGRILGRGPGEVHLWARNPDARERLRQEVPGIDIHHDMGEALDGASVVFLAIPAGHLLEVAEAYGEHARGDHVVLTGSRGVGEGFMLPHEMIRAKTCVRKIGILGGPIHARELATGRQINAILASKFPRVIEAVRKLTHGSPVSLHGSKDIVGVQVSGAISNVGSLAAGMADALDLGDTARGVLLTHGLLDAKRLGLALGASADTFAGLAGLGELIPRHVTSMDRHLELGAKLAQGQSAEEAVASTEGHVEGVQTAREATKLAEAKGVSLSLVRAVTQILDGSARPREALESVLHQSLDLG